MGAVADSVLVLVASAREAIAAQPLTGLEFIDACDVVAAAIANVSALGRIETRLGSSRIHGSLLGCAVQPREGSDDAQWQSREPSRGCVAALGRAKRWDCRAVAQQIYRQSKRCKCPCRVLAISIAEISKKAQHYVGCAVARGL